MDLEGSVGLSGLDRAADIGPVIIQSSGTIPNLPVFRDSMFAEEFLTMEAE
ncbi:MAG: hypothetical protein K9M97_04295 [Akkermansiaceae bacterium]|nr:hypothetical protein [Akkermansiaceae bacterium]